MNPSEQDRYSHPSPLSLGKISLEHPSKDRPHTSPRIKLPTEDPFSLKVIEQLEREGLFVRWKYGYKLGNRYEVRRIHSGGMGIVWIVEDLFDNRKPYAAKSVKPFFRKPVTHEQWQEREKSIRRFLEECKIWVDLEKHRHIVYAEFLEETEGVPLVMSEYIDGGDLTKWAGKGALPIETMLVFAIQFCIGMEYANSRGVLLHRDIKPGNLMIEGEILKINDFGLSKAIESAENIRREEGVDSEPAFDFGQMSTSRGMGTPLYMAPEQFSKRILEYVGHSTYPITIPADVFSLGLMLYEMVKGIHPYMESRDQRVWERALKIAPKVSIPHGHVFCFLKSINLNLSPPISGNEHLDNLISKCVKKNPSERYQGFTELKEELMRIYHQVTGKQFEIIIEPPPKANFKNKGKTAFMIGREKEAIEFYDKALEENPGDTAVWLEKGLAMAEMGKLQEFKLCMEIVSYLRPSKIAITSSHERTILRGTVLGGGQEIRDQRLLNEIGLRYPLTRELRDYISQIKKGRYDQIFKSLDPEKNYLFKKDDHETATWTLTELKDITIPTLINALKDEDFDVRKKAAWALTKLKDPSAIPALVEALKDDHTYVSNEAVWVLGGLKDPSAIPALIEALKDEHAYVRENAARALTELQDPSTIPALIEVLKDEHAGVRVQAAMALALGELKDPSAIPVLIEALKDEQADVREKAAWILGELQDPSAIPVLIEALKDEQADVREKAAWALGELQDPSAIPALVEALKDEQADVREKAAWALREFKDPSTIPALIEALKDEQADVRKNAVWALAELKDPSTIPALMEALKDGHADVGSYAMDTLRHIWSEIGKEKIENLKESLRPYSSFEWNKKGLENLEACITQEAIKCFQKAIEIDPDWKEPRENLKKAQMAPV